MLCGCVVMCLVVSSMCEVARVTLVTPPVCLPTGWCLSEPGPLPPLLLLPLSSAPLPGALQLPLHHSQRHKPHPPCECGCREAEDLPSGRGQGSDLHLLQQVSSSPYSHHSLSLSLSSASSLPLCWGHSLCWAGCVVRLCPSPLTPSLSSCTCRLVCT